MVGGGVAPGKRARKLSTCADSELQGGVDLGPSSPTLSFMHAHASPVFAVATAVPYSPSMRFSLDQTRLRSWSIDDPSSTPARHAAGTAFAARL